MPTKEDIPADAHHLRLEVADLKPFYESLATFPGSKAIVIHKNGKTGEHPHLHVFFQLERKLTKVALKDRLRAHNEIFGTLKGQTMWSFRPHDNYTTWCKYVCRNLSHEIIKSDEELDKIHEETPKVPIVADSPIRGAPQARIIVKKRTVAERLVSYCEAEYKWVLNTQFTLDSYYDGTAKKMVGRALVEFTKGRFNDPQAVYMLRNLLYEFADDDLREFLKDHYPAASMKFL